MKIYVDKIPEQSCECLFSDYFGGGRNKCKFDNCFCVLESNNKCEHLIEFKEKTKIEYKERKC